MKNLKKGIQLFLILSLQIAFAQSSDKSSSNVPLVDPVTNCALRYYYFPNIEAYFDTKKKIYYYKEDGEWITGEEIPYGYRGYSVYKMLNVFITDYDEDSPYQLLNTHKKRYPYTSNGRIKQLTASND